MDAYEVNLDSIFAGGLREAFQIELAKIAANVGDRNTSLKKVRALVMTLKFTPFADRSGCSVETMCNSALGQLDTSALTGTVYLAKRDGKFTFFSRDLRQEQLFFPDDDVAPPDGKTAASGG